MSLFNPWKRKRETKELSSVMPTKVKKGTQTNEGFEGILSHFSDNSEKLYVAFYTYKVASGIVWDKKFFPELKDIPHLLELRAFNENVELRALRMGIYKDFKWRLADEKGLDSEADIYRETHYLDIDHTRAPEPCQDGVNTAYASTTGAVYTLPIRSGRWPAKIKIINYLAYDGCGNLQIKDYRLAGFEMEE
ncbi:MAG: hypothetical protein LBT59_22070 [Clostridiales bacterium]|nr:hypothetical protein [Clostridiales bacterium]